MTGEDHGDRMIDKIALREIITKLDPKERQVIIMRYFQDKTQSQIAEAIGVSQVQVSRIEKRVLKTLRAKLEV
jgi:RNA polymerase sporulation-specific sigma factor